MTRNPPDPQDEGTGEPASRPPGLPPPAEYSGYPGGPRRGQPDLMTSPFVLAGLVMLGSVLLAIFVVVLFRGGGESGGVVLPGSRTPDDGTGLTARSIAIATVREGPGLDYVELGVLGDNQDVQVVGRNGDASWFQILYPPQSLLRGWVPASALRVSEELTARVPIADVTPIPRPTVVQPTLPPEPTAPLATPTLEAATAVATAPPGPTSQAALDLAVGILNSSCQSGLPLVVTIQNVGGAQMTNRQVRVTASHTGGQDAVIDVLLQSLTPGEVLNVPTGQQILPPRTSARIDLLGAPPDTNPGNNLVHCVTFDQPPQPPDGEDDD